MLPVVAEARASRALGCALVGASIWAFIVNARFEEHLTPTVGNVVASGRSWDDGEVGGVKYEPTIEFETMSGKRVEFKSTAARYAEPSIGELVEVQYLESDPKVAREKGTGPAALFAGIGLVGLVMIFGRRDHGLTTRPGAQRAHF